MRRKLPAFLIVFLVLGGAVLWSQFQNERNAAPADEPAAAPSPPAGPLGSFPPTALEVAVSTDSAAETEPAGSATTEVPPEARLAQKAWGRLGPLIQALADEAAYVEGAELPDPTLTEISPEVRARLFATLEGGSPQEKVQAALALSEAQLAPEDLALLQRQMEAELGGMKTEQQKNLVLALAYALDAHGDLSGLARLTDAIATGEGSEVAGFRNGAVFVLAMLEHADSGPVLREVLLSDPESEVRRHAAMGLGKFGGEENRAALTESLGSEQETGVRVWTALAAGRAVPKGAGDPVLLSFMQNDPEGVVRGASAYGLSRSGGKGTTEDLLSNYYQDDDRWSRIGTVAGLAKRGGEKSRDFLITEGSPYLEGLAREGEDPWSRMYAAGILASTPATETRGPALREVATKDDNPYVRRAAIESLAKTEGKEALPFLKARLPEEKDEAVRKELEQRIRRLDQ